MVRLFSIILGLSVFGLDLWSKGWAKSALPPDRTWPIVDGLFRLHYVQNEGIAFGLMHSFQSDWKPLLLSAAALLALGIVFYYIWSTPVGERRLFLAFGLLVGGILGNFTDRLMHGFVVDFLELHWQEKFIWPTFNMADAAITCGVALILLDTLFGAGEKKASTADEPAGDAGPSAAGGSSLALMAFLLIPLSAPPLGAVQGGSPSASQMIESLQQRYDTVESLSARFQQITSDRGITQEEEGFLLMKRPGRMRWEYTAPTRKIFIADGKKSYFYNVEEKQVVESDLDLEDEGSPLLMLMGRGRLLSDFEAAFEKEEQPRRQSSRLVRLTPRPSQSQSDIEYVLLEFDPQSNRIGRLSVIDPIGNRNDYILSDVQENLPIQNKRFRLKIPNGVERIKQ